MRQLSTKRQSRALPLDRHNTTDIDKNAKAALSPLTDTIRQLSTKHPKPLTPPRPTQCDSYRQKRKSLALPSSDTMRQISTKTPLPCSHPRPTQYDSYRQTHQSRALPLDRHNATDIDKTSEATHSTSTDIIRQLPTKTQKPCSSPRPTQCDSYRQTFQSRTLHLVRHNATDIDKNTKAALFPHPT